MKFKILQKFYIGLILLFIYLPIALVVLYSFNESKTSAAWTGFSFKWYSSLFRNKGIGNALMVSLKVALSSAVIATVVGTLGALGMNRLKRLRILINGLIYIPLVIPEIIMAVSLLVFFSFLPIEYGMLTLILSHATFCIPYMLILIQIRLSTLDPLTVEAARDLGASNWEVFFTIILPFITPALISGNLLCMALSLDDVVISFFVSGPGDTPLAVKIFSMLRLGVTPEINALCTLMLLFSFIAPIFILNSVDIKKFFGG